MSTFLFEDIIFGPVKSRRLGISLGVNLLPTQHKICNYNCIYCECGWSGLKGKQPLPKKETVIRILRETLYQRQQEQLPLDSITFAGNGEPTIHPRFAEIIDETLSLRDQYFPSSLVSVLTNGSKLADAHVVAALRSVDKNIIKLDGGNDEMIALIDQPYKQIPLTEQIELIKQFKGKCVIQTIFLRGIVDGKNIDNTTDEQVAAWIELVKDIAPKEVMIYAIDRDTPSEGLEKVTHKELEQIADKLRNKDISVVVG